MNSKSLEHIYLVDGSGYIFRAFFAIPPMTRPDGTPVNAVFGFTKMLMKLVADSDGDGLAVIFDDGRRSFASVLYTKTIPHQRGPESRRLDRWQSSEKISSTRQHHVG